MSRSKLTILWSGIIVFLNVLGAPYLSNLSGFVWVYYDLFLIICAMITIQYLRSDLKKCIIPVFLFAYWALHNSLALFRLGYIKKYSVNDIEKEFLIVLLSTIILYIGVNLGLRIKTKPLKLSKYEELSDKTYLVVMAVYFVYFFAKIYFAGGLYNYLFSDYQFKIPESLQTIFFVVKNILTGFDYFNLLYVVKRGTKISVLAKFFFAFSLFNVFIGGGSTGILYLLVCLVAVLIFKSKNSIQVSKYIRRGIPVAIIGIYVGILIRFNRTNYSEFSFNVLNNAMDSILGSATFDCQENLLRVLRDFTPTYSLQQFIYPFVNWMPRSLFPWKPTELGTVMASTYHNFASNANAGFATTPMADFYYDFGYLGMVIGILLEGCFIGWMQRKYYISDLRSDVTLWALVFSMYICSNVPNWYTGFGIRIFYLFVFYMILKMITRVWGGKVAAKNE